MRFFMVIFLLFGYACVTSGKGNVRFSSKNFQNILTWDPADPGESVLYSVSYGLIDNEVFHDKAECQNISERLCDLTAETPPHHDTYYRAKVFADGSFYGMSRNFKPSAHTVLGAPTLSFNTSRTSLHMSVTLPVGPNNASFQDIFHQNHKGASEAVVLYTLVITEPLRAAQNIKNTTGHFDVSLKNDGTKYCGFVVYTPVHELGRPLSEKASFCIKLQEPQGNPRMWPWLLLGVVVVAAVLFMVACFAKHYAYDVKNEKLPLRVVSNPQSVVICDPKKEEDIAKLEILPGSENTGYAKIQIQPNGLSSVDGGYGHTNSIFVHFDDTSGTEALHCPHGQDDSAPSSDIYSTVVQGVDHQLKQTENNKARLLFSGNGLVEREDCLSTLKTTSTNSDSNDAQLIFLKTQQNSEGELTLSCLLQTFALTVEELVPLERKPRLSYLTVPLDEGDTLESSERLDSGLDENTLPFPSQDCDHSQCSTSQPDLTHFSPGSFSCDSGTSDSGYKQNWMPSSTHETFKTNYSWTWSGTREEDS